MPPLTVFFKPRPAHDLYGTEWMPHFKDPYGPFLPCYEPVPPAAIDRREIDCSSALENHLEEFYGEISLLLTVPAIESAPLSKLYADWTARQESYGPIIRHSRVVMREACARYRALGLDDSPADAILGPANRPLKTNAHLSIELILRDLPSMEDAFIELKIWACSLHVLADYTDRARRFSEELNRRGSPWDRVCAAGILLNEDIHSLFSKKLSTPAAGVFAQTTASLLQSSPSYAGSEGSEPGMPPIYRPSLYSRSMQMV
ncbi:hypothetical protein FB451DRAFT_1559427 [Mycena latifolia]|nr:hypothetical protein FB451DRAFT_1559427 [Mycena latifolia]